MFRVDKKNYIQLIIICRFFKLSLFPHYELLPNIIVHATNYDPLTSTDIYLLPPVMVTSLVVPELVPPVQVEAAMAEQVYVLVRPKL